MIVRVPRIGHARSQMVQSYGGHGKYGKRTMVHLIRKAALLVATAMLASATTTGTAHARCDEGRLAAFLESRFFSLSAERKIRRYADELYRYYGDRDISRRAVLRQMQDWEDRWPDRIYKFMRVHDFETTDDERACRVTFDYKFVAYSYRRDKLSAGLGRTTIVLADLYDEDRMRIVAEHGTVLCRGMRAFQRNRC